MPSVGSIYNANYGNFTEEHDYDVAEDLVSKEDLVLADPPYFVRWDQAVAHMEYHLLDTTDIQDRA